MPVNIIFFPYEVSDISIIGDIFFLIYQHIPGFPGLNIEITAYFSYVMKPQRPLLNVISSVSHTCSSNLLKISLGECPEEGQVIDFQGPYAHNNL